MVMVRFTALSMISFRVWVRFRVQIRVMIRVMFRICLISGLELRLDLK